MAKGYPTACSSCGERVITLLDLSHIPTECPKCQIMHNDMKKSKYVINLVAFLSEKLGLTRGSTINVIRAKGGGIYTVILEKKGEEPELIATIEFTPKDRLLLTNKAIANIQAKKPEIRDIITAFIKKYGSEANIPLADIRRF